MNQPLKSATSAAPRRVLFVDDDQRFLETVKELMSVLSEGRWEIFTAESASQAFGLLQQQPVDLAVIDINMGVMDGIQMLSMLNRGYPAVQKVVLTGHASEKYRAACLSNGAELYLEKPTNPNGWQSLHGLLNEVVKLRPEEGFRGVLRRVGLPDVIQMECLARSSSVLEVSSAQTTGRLFIDTGQIIHAQCGDLVGEEAFNRLLSMSGGQFNLRPFSEPPKRSLSGQWEFLLMEAARKSDEEREAQAATAATEPASETIAAEIDRLAAVAVQESQSPSEPDPAVTPGEAFVSAPPSESVMVSVPEPASRPKVEEVLVCSAQGEALYEWHCANTDLWVNFFEFVSQRGHRLALALPLGEFNRLEIQSGRVRVVVIITNDRGVMVKTRREAAAGWDQADESPMGEDLQTHTTQWLRKSPGVRGTLARGIRFSDKTFVTEVNDAKFAEGAIEPAWRMVADAFQVLRAQHLTPTRLNWVFERAVLHCVQRADGALFGVIVTRKHGEVDLTGLSRLLMEFQSNMPMAI